MTVNELRVKKLIALLLGEMPQHKDDAAAFPPSPKGQRRLLRALMNVRPPLPMNENFLRDQDALLQAEANEKGIVTIFNSYHMSTSS